MKTGTLTGLLLVAMSAGLVACSGSESQATADESGSKAGSAGTAGSGARADAGTGSTDDGRDDDGADGDGDDDGDDDADAGAGRDSEDDDARAGAGSDDASGGTRNGTGGTKSTGGRASSGGSGGSSGSVDPDPGSNAGAGGDDAVAGDTTPYSIDAFQYDQQADTRAPLGAGATLAHKEEIVMIRPSLLSGGVHTAGWLFEDSAKRANTESAIYPDAGIGAKVTDVARGDFDGDGHPEIAVASLFESGRLYGYPSDSLRITVLGRPNEATKSLDLGGTNESVVRAWITTGDYDGDGRAEILVSALLGYGYSVGGNPAVAPTAGRLYVVSVGDSSLKAIRTLEFPGVTELRGTFANLDDDAKSEIAVHTRTDQYSHVARLRMFDDERTGAAPLFDVEADARTLSSTPLQGFVVAGNFDDDPEQEVAWLNLGEYGIVGTVYDGAKNAFAARSLNYADLPPIQGTFARDELTDSVAPRATFVAADVNGDGRDEINALLSTPGAYPSWSLRILDPLSLGLESLEVGPYDFAHLAGINDDLDAASELIVSTGGGRDVFYSEYDASRQLRFGRLNTPNRVFVAAEGTPFVTGGDFDGDSLVVRYLGEPRLALANPTILVALAAPPTQGGIEQAYANSATIYGTQQSSSHSKTDELSVKVGATVSFEAEDPLKIVKAEVSATLEAEFTMSETETSIVTTGVNYSTTEEDDSVVFLGTLFRIYPYEIVAADDAALVGTTMEVNVPLDNKVYIWTKERFNRIFTNPALQIGAETFSHTPLDVASYPNAARRDALLAASENQYKSDEVAVGLGDGKVGVSIALGEETAQAKSYGFSMTIEASVAVGGAGVGWNAGVGASHNVEVKVGTTSTYEGAVGNIGNDADYDRYQYSFGMFLNDVSRGTDVMGNDVRYQVVNYWVDDLGPGYR